MTRERKSPNQLFEADEQRRARQVRSGIGRHRGRYIDLPAERLSPQRVMSQCIPKPVIGALAQHVPRDAWLAARAHWGAEGGVVRELRELLMREARDIADREGWETKTTTHCSQCGEPYKRDAYVHRLVLLALTEFAEPRQVPTVAARHEWFGCSGAYWRRVHAKRYEAVYDVLLRWLFTAARFIWDNQPWDDSRAA